MKEASVSWSKPEGKWIIRYWSEENQEWYVDRMFDVKDVDDKTELGWVPEEFICRLIRLQELGYKIWF